MAGLGIAPFSIAMIGSIATGVVGIGSMLGIGCAFGPAYCAYKGSFGKEEKYLHGHDRRAAIDVLATFHPNNTDLTPDEWSRLGGLRADVLDANGNAAFTTDFVDASNGTLIEFDPRPMPLGMGMGEFSFVMPRPCDVKPDATVQGKWLYVNPDTADEKTREIFHLMRNRSTALVDVMPTDVADPLTQAIVEVLGVAESATHGTQTKRDVPTSPYSTKNADVTKRTHRKPWMGSCCRINWICKWVHKKECEWEADHY